jgi:hypothetical protein
MQAAGEDEITTTSASDDLPIAEGAACVASAVVGVEMRIL